MAKKQIHNTINQLLLKRRCNKTGVDIKSGKHKQRGNDYYKRTIHQTTQVIQKAASVKVQSDGNGNSDALTTTQVQLNTLKEQEETLKQMLKNFTDEKGKSLSGASKAKVANAIIARLTRQSGS